ncbi:hypothetical protein ACG74X_10325 [Marivita sp. S0852]|uniref:hypothetical protein n=1 Tax=Marivita sp. S0852 TaxID=3373893 RepID=UPI0039822934
MTVPETTDSLLARVAMADQSAFQLLYSRTSGALFGLCYHLIDDHAEAETCLQDLFTAIWQNADAFRDGDLAPMARLVIEARAAAIAIKRVRFSPTDTVDTRDLFTGPGTDHETTQDTMTLDACLRDLQPARALLLRRVCLDGDGYGDLAAASDVEASTVRASLQKALNTVGTCLMPDRTVSVTAAEYALCLLPELEAEQFEAKLADEPEAAAEVALWHARLAEFILATLPPKTPPPQLLRRLKADVFSAPRTAIWQQIWPYAVGGGIAALVLWLAVSSNVLVGF